MFDQCQRCKDSCAPYSTRLHLDYGQPSFAAHLCEACQDAWHEVEAVDARFLEYRKLNAELSIYQAVVGVMPRTEENALLVAEKLKAIYARLSELGDEVYSYAKTWCEPEA